MKKAEVQTGGKLYLAGEYAILKPGAGAIIQFIPIFMKGNISSSASYCLTSDLFDYSVDMTPNADYALIQETVQVMEEWLLDSGIDCQPFRLEISGKMERNGKKFGLGSSGSIVLLVLKAMAAFYHLNLSSDLLFRLASYVLLQRGDNGSMGDLACIAYEDLVYYQSFDRQWLREEMGKISLSDLLQLDWGYVIRPLHPQLSFDFLVGWTQKPAISSHLVKEVTGVITPQFIEKSDQAVRLLEQGLVEGDSVFVSRAIERASAALHQLSPLIYTDALIELEKAVVGLAACAKSSGAGGGDCGIALVFEEEARPLIVKRWQEKGIELLYQERIEGTC